MKKYVTPVLGAIAVVLGLSGLLLPALVFLGLFALSLLSNWHEDYP